MTVSSFFLELLDNRIVPACSGFGHSRDVTLRPETILEEGSAVVSLQSLWQGWWWTNHEARACCNFEGTSWRWGQDVIDVRDVGGKPFTSDFLRSFRISKLKTVFFFFGFAFFQQRFKNYAFFFGTRSRSPFFSPERRSRRWCRKLTSTATGKSPSTSLWPGGTCRPRRTPLESESRTACKRQKAMKVWPSLSRLSYDPLLVLFCKALIRNNLSSQFAV